MRRESISYRKIRHEARPFKERSPLTGDEPFFSPFGITQLVKAQKQLVFYGCLVP